MKGTDTPSAPFARSLIGLPLIGERFASGNQRLATAVLLDDDHNEVAADRCALQNRARLCTVRAFAAMAAGLGSFGYHNFLTLRLRVGEPCHLFISQRGRELFAGAFSEDDEIGGAHVGTPV